MSNRAPSILAKQSLRYAWLAGLGLLMGCGPGVVGTSGFFFGALLFAGALALMTPTRRVVPAAQAGAPVGCDGWESNYCNEGSVGTHCCPKHAKCNFADPPYVDCGSGLCVTGFDVGRCKAPLPHVLPKGAADTKDKCAAEHGSWELVCAEKVVAHACIPPMPTNYSGAGWNPRFTACGAGQRLESKSPAAPGDRCTTHILKEDCYPTQQQLGDDKCLGDWQEVCLGGKVEKRCLPVSVPPLKSYSWRATEFVKCDDGSCAVGETDQKRQLCQKH